MDQVRAFIAVAEELHFGRAADRLRMTQPPLSRQIQRLEATIGVRLFERNNRRVDLTEAGKAFLVESRRLLGVATAAPEVARLVAAGSVGVLRIGFTAASAFGLMGAVLNRLSDVMPDVSVELREMVTRDQLTALDNREIDIAIARPVVDPEIYRSRLLTSEALVAAIPAEHPLTRRTRPLSADDLTNEDLIMHSPLDATYFYDMVVRLLPVSRWKYTHTVSQIVTMVGLVAAGRGIAIVPASASQLGFGAVRFAPLMTPEPQPVELHAIWRQDDRRPLVHRTLQELRPDALV
ncbi:LysR family transcriptional regulator [Citricoccus alkalitolerans]|uniref:LysR family transcriptional regulator n=1 Tax=Citricoccus alkalitolerans TaxID=246603 RepID=A0ABV8XRW5_9MICC